MNSQSRNPRSGRAAVLLLIGLAIVIAGAWAGPKIYRRYFKRRPPAMWIVKRHTEVVGYGQARELLAKHSIQVDEEEHHIDEVVRDRTIARLDGTQLRLSEAARHGALLIALRDPACPVRGDYGAKLAALEKEFADRDVAFLYLYTGDAAKAEVARADLEAHGLGGEVGLDVASELATELGATTTADVFVLDSARTLLYRGALDDELKGGDVVRPAERHFGREAIAAALKDMASGTRATFAPGAELALEKRAPLEEITYHNRVSRIVQGKCTVCHQEGGVGPFPLEKFEQVKGRKGMVKFMVEDRLMPPWGAEHGTGPWTNDESLTESQRSDILSWIAAGCPEGDSADEVRQRNLPKYDEWLIGEPDYVISNEPFTIPAEGSIEIQKTIISQPFPEDRWVTAVQFLNQVQGVLHHSTLFYVDGDGRLFFVDAYLPGKSPTYYPEGEARFIPKGAKFRFDIHYTPKGIESVDQLEVGLLFSDTPPVREIHSLWMNDRGFTIPPGDPNYSWQYEFELPRPVMLKQFMPHMHLRGKTFLAEAVLPSGESIELLHVPQWDADWQFAYELVDPITVPEGTLLRCTGWWDNSADNPNNPDPTQEVGYGQQIWDEMMGFGVDFIDP